VGYNTRMPLGDPLVLFAVLAAAGTAVVWLAIVTPRQVRINTAQRIDKVGFLDKFRREFESSGIQMGFSDFLRVALMASVVAFAILSLLGFFVLGVATAALLPVLWYQFLIDRRDKFDRNFRVEFSNVILNFSNILAVRGSVEAAISTLAAEGDDASRRIFQRIIRMQNVTISDKQQRQDALTAGQMAVATIASQRLLKDVLLEVANERPGDIYWRQFFELIADASEKGGDIRPALESLAKAQKDFAGILNQIEAQQASTRLASVLYGPAPIVFLVFFSLVGDPQIYRAFYQTPVGSVVQALVALSGAAGWIMARRLGRRGLYIQKQVIISKDKDSMV